MFEPSFLYVNLLFGFIGLGYFIYGKKQSKMIPLAAGLMLGIVPYFIHNLSALILVSTLLMLAPYFLRNY